VTNIKLSKRLQAIADMVDIDSSIVDIGCDHALLDIYLLKNNIVKKAIASDITSGAVKQAMNNVKIYNEEKLIVKQADGLDSINKSDNINTIIISGLGNQTIINILSKDINKLSKIDTLIIQSNTGYYELRKNICKLGYKIIDEKIIKDNNIKYIIMKYKKGSIKYSYKELLLGPILIKNKNNLFTELVNDYISKNNNIIKALPKKYILKKVKLIRQNNLLKKEIQK